MATTNANESRARDSFINTKGKPEYKAGGYQKVGGNHYNKPRDNNYKPRDNNFKTRDNYSKPKENNGKPNENNVRYNSNISGNSEYKHQGYLHKGISVNQKDNLTKSRENYDQSKGNVFRTRDNYDRPTENKYKPADNKYKPAGSYPIREKSNSFGERSKNSYSYVDKDDDTDSRNYKGRKLSETKSKSSAMKDKEQQPEKLETIRRLEREKKVIQKKNREEEIEKPKRPIAKQKRSIKDLTKGYKYGLLEEDEHYLEY